MRRETTGRQKASTGDLRAEPLAIHRLATVARTFANATAIGVRALRVWSMIQQPTGTMATGSRASRMFDHRRLAMPFLTADRS